MGMTSLRKLEGAAFAVLDDGSGIGRSPAVGCEVTMRRERGLLRSPGVVGCGVEKRAVGSELLAVNWDGGNGCDKTYPVVTTVMFWVGEGPIVGFANDSGHGEQSRVRGLDSRRSTPAGDFI